MLVMLHNILHGRKIPFLDHCRPVFPLAGNKGHATEILGVTKDPENEAQS